MDKKAEGERENLPNQKALEQLEQLIQKFKSLRSQIAHYISLKGDKGFNPRSCENLYDKLYGDTIVFLTRYLPECAKNDSEGFVAIVQREATAELHQRGNLAVDLARMFLSPLAKIEKLTAQTNACIAILELYKLKYFTEAGHSSSKSSSKLYDESQLGTRRNVMKASLLLPL